MDLELLKLAALKTGLGLNYISKEEKISLLLKQLTKVLPEDIVLKGGTALNGVYLAQKNVNRFSEDLDIDYISKKSLNTKIKYLKLVMKKIEGFEVGTGRLLHRTLRFNCKYANELGNTDVVRVEYYLSHITPLCVKKPKKKPLQSTYLSTETVVYPVYALEDLLARKLVAYYSRGEGKDLYDLFHGLELDYDRKALRKALMLILKFKKIYLPVKEFYRGISNKLQESLKSISYIRDSTNHYVPTGLRPDWGELIRSLKEKISMLE
jgi:predicted nucleotidyltransferase component of viral defense system